MARRIELKPHLTTEELQTRYRSCQKLQEKVRWHALHLISKGMVAAGAARRTGRASSWITTLARRYNREGAKAVARKPSTKPSHRAKVDQKLRKALDTALRSASPDGGVWTAPKVALGLWKRAVRKFTKRRRGAPCVGAALAFRCRVRQTRGGHQRKSSWSSKKIELQGQALQKAYPAEEVEVRSEDEARFGLKPVLRRVWSPVGERPQASVDDRYEWLWLYAATHPRTGRVFWLVLPRPDAACVQLFPEEFAKEYAGEGTRILLVWDGAPAHRAHSVQVPERISVISLPACTPELNPGERVWPLVTEGVANQAHQSMDELEQKVCVGCQKISAAEVSARTSYHWWPSL